MNTKALVFCLAAGLIGTAACSTTPPATKAATPPPAASSPAKTATGTTVPATTAADQDFTLANETGVVIDQVFISPHDSDDWEEDVLGTDTLASGASVDITFQRAEKAPLWDLRIEDDKDNSIEWENLNLLEISKITLIFKDGKATAKTE